MQRTRIEKAIHYHQQGKADRARELYRKILKTSPHDVDALHFYGLLNYQQGNAGKAIELIEQALVHKPDYPDAWNNLGNIHLRLERLDEARHCYEQALQLAPYRIETHNNLGVLLRYLDELPASIRHLEQALALKPDWADAHYNLANSLVVAGSDEQAVHHYRAAIRFDPRYSIALKRLGTLLYGLGRIEETVKLYRDWLELEPGNPVVSHMLAACSGEHVPGRASADYLRQTFDEFAASFDSKLEELEYRTPQQVADIVRGLFPAEAGRLYILDAGCGTGLCGPLLRGMAEMLSGVDLSPKMLDRARQRNCYDALACEDLVEHINRFADTFDIIVSADTLIYFGELSKVMQAAANALKPNGYLVFSLEKLAGEDAYPSYRLEPHGRYAHSRDYIESVVNAAGLELAGLDEVVLRMELGQPVAGWIATTKKRGADTDIG